MFVYICQNIDVKSRISDYSLNESPINQHVSSKSAINQQSTTKTPEVSRFFSSQTIQQPVPGWEAVWNSWQIGSCNLTKSILTSIIDNIMIYIYIYIGLFWFVYLDGIWSTCGLVGWRISISWHRSNEHFFLPLETDAIASSAYVITSPWSQVRNDVVYRD